MKTIAFKDHHFRIEWKVVQSNISHDKREESTKLKLKMQPTRTIPVSTDAEISDRDKLAFFIFNISISNVLPDISTIELAKKLVELKNYYLRLALCLLDKSPNSLDEDVKKKLISIEDQKLIWLKAQQYILLWDLLSKYWEQFQGIFKNLSPSYHFESPLDFFCEFFQRQFDENFLEYTKPIFHDIPKDWSQMMTLLKRKESGKSLTNEEQSNLERLIESNNFAHLSVTKQWEIIINDICLMLKNQNPDIDIDQDFNEINKLREEGIRLYEKKILHKSSPCTWIDGVMYRGTCHKTADGKIHYARINKSR